MGNRLLNRAVPVAPSAARREVEVVHGGPLVSRGSGVEAGAQEDAGHAGAHRGALDGAVVLVELHALHRALIIDGPGNDEVPGDPGLAAARLVVAGARLGAAEAVVDAGPQELAAVGRAGRVGPRGARSRDHRR